MLQAGINDEFIEESARTFGERSRNISKLPPHIWPQIHDWWPYHHCYVRQCSLSYTLLLELSRGLASHILSIVCTAIHNCSSLSSFSSQHLGSMWKEIMWLIWLQLQLFIDTNIHSYNIVQYSKYHLNVPCKCVPPLLVSSFSIL